MSGGLCARNDTGEGLVVIIRHMVQRRMRLYDDQSPFYTQQVKGIHRFQILGPVQREEPDLIRVL